MKGTKDLGDYLGYPIIHSKVNKQTFNVVISKTTIQLLRWKANAPSQAGRSILLNQTLHLKLVIKCKAFLPKTIDKPK